VEVIAAYDYDFAGLLSREDRYGQSYPNNDWRADYGYDRTGPANQLQTDGTYDYQYDAEGNMVKKTEIATGQVTTFEHDHRNLMHRATIWSSDPSDGGVILHEEQYRYDAHNRRTSILIDADGAGPEQGLVSPAVDG
jgi:YD repeat-containing protein